ncbi:uncharacterized protein SCHCODRAFT_02665961 [Schizophyllum commune H4-8]|uniref:uncharacterized protein n=1 Tax=Schizophyllum commune (strain H4-8 / FGSC 9210) TaxID=578458 RepID=UPI00215E84C2|nr:uncharacterized protein SCHCODRAFT_02665961 [Schizophyllum commune H4-8]KAI5895653.1 hypothetical protein SCHCODRAFT_02665961 [Schizophyllum commune H4-8]
MEIGLDLAEVDFSCLSPSSSRGLSPVTRHPQPRRLERLERAGAHRARKGLPHPSPALRRPGSGLPSPKRDRRKRVRAPGALIPPNLPTFARLYYLNEHVDSPFRTTTDCRAFLALSSSRHASTHFERAPSIDTKRVLTMLNHPHNDCLQHRLTLISPLSPAAQDDETALDQALHNDEKGYATPSSSSVDPPSNRRQGLAIAGETLDQQIFGVAPTAGALRTHPRRTTRRGYPLQIIPLSRNRRERAKYGRLDSIDIVETLGEFGGLISCSLTADPLIESRMQPPARRQQRGVVSQPSRNLNVKQGPYFSTPMPTEKATIFCRPRAAGGTRGVPRRRMRRGWGTLPFLLLYPDVGPLWPPPLGHFTPTPSRRRRAWGILGEFLLTPSRRRHAEGLSAKAATRVGHPPLPLDKRAGEPLTPVFAPPFSLAASRRRCARGFLDAAREGYSPSRSLRMPFLSAISATGKPPEACAGLQEEKCGEGGVSSLAKALLLTEVGCATRGRGIATPSTSFEVVQVDISTRVEMHLTSSSTPPRPLSDRRKHAGPRNYLHEEREEGEMPSSSPPPFIPPLSSLHPSPLPRCTILFASASRRRHARGSLGEGCDGGGGSSPPPFSLMPQSLRGRIYIDLKLPEARASPLDDEHEEGE